MRWWCRGTLAVLSLSLVAASDKSKTQQMPLPTMGETIEVSIVNVDVFVTNKAGKRIQGLTRDDFEVFENGVKQPLTNFAEYAAPHPDPLPASRGEGTEATDTQKRTVVVFVERFRLPGTKAGAIVGSMKRLLHDTIRPGDAATVVTWYRGRLETLQPYTDDLASLDRALDAVKVQNTEATLDDYAEARANAQGVEDFELEGQAFAAENGAAESTIVLMQESAEEMKGMAGRTDALRARADLELKVRTINALMRSMAGFDGKRVLLLATHRLSKIAGAEFYWANGVVENLDSLDRMELDTSSTIRSLHETANANGVVIYPMFPEGLGSSGAPVTTAGRFQPGGSSAFEYFIQDNEVPVLKELAARTGGKPAWGSNEVTELLASVRDDFETYYSLAYRTTPRSKDKARAVEVRLKDPEFRSRSRREVIEKSDVTRMEDHVLASLVRNDAGSTLPFSVKVGTPRGKKLRIPVTIRVPISALTILPNGPNQSGGFSVYVAWGAKVGGISEATHERQLFHIPNADLAKAKKSFFTYEFQLAADRRTDRISVGVVDEVSREYGVRVYRMQPDAQAVLQPLKSN